MLHFIRQHRLLLLILLLVLISLHLLSSGLRKQSDVSFVGKVILTVYTPIYSVLSWPFVNISSGLSHYLYLVEVKETNERLREQNTVLTGNLVELRELRAENERLTTLLDLEILDRRPVAYARVIGRGNQAEFHVLLIDKGTGDGVEKGMAVAAPSGLVGYVAAAVPGAAKVVLITDAGARIDAILQRTREPAMIIGRGEKMCTVRYVAPDADVAEGDRLVTSGLGGIFPKGISVGFVHEVKRGEFEVIQEITVATAVDLDTLEEVAVLPSNSVNVAGLKP